MNTSIANKLADAVTIVEQRDGFEAAAEIQTAIDLSSNTQCARVVSGETVLLDWISASADTAREADRIVFERIRNMNDELDAKLEGK